ncbi:hypothetical protein, partial [Escherichia coli]|uniref:hypothetical protein n=1 Tax=Escherichia coli TaxID=562 RepID=UPI002151203A
VYISKAVAFSLNAHFQQFPAQSQNSRSTLSLWSQWRNMKWLSHRFNKQSPSINTLKLKNSPESLGIKTPEVIQTAI